MKKTLIFTLLLIAGITCFGQKVTLALNLKQGNTYYMNTSAKLLVSELINGQQQDINTTITVKVAHKVVAMTDSTYEMEIRYERVAMKMTAGGQNMDFDSEKKDKSIFTTIMSGMVNRPFSIVLTKTGKVRSINNIENLYSHMFDSIPTITDAQKAQFKGQMEKSFGANTFKGNMEEAFAVFPDIKVAKNDKWVVNTKLESVVSAITTTTYVLQDVTGDTYQVHGDGLIRSAGSAEYKEMNSFPMKFTNVTGNATTDLKLDKTTGWITEARINKVVKGTIDIKDNPKVPGGMVFPITVTGDSVISDK